MWHMRPIPGIFGAGAGLPVDMQRVKPVVLYEIIEAVAHPDHTVTITWSDGARGVVDFLPMIDRGGWFTPLRDPDYFVATMLLLPGGIGLTWPEEIDYSADGLRRDAFPDGLPAATSPP